MTRIARSLSLGIALAVLVFGRFDMARAQATGASVVGTVRDAESGRALSDAFAVSGQRFARSDSLGRWVLSAMPAGATRIRVRSIGFTQFDTTIALSAAGETRLDVRLKRGFLFEPDARKAEATNIAAGRTDSSALGLLRRTPADSSLTFGSFGARFLRTIASGRAPDSNTVLSPISAAFALSIPLLGAGGATAHEIATVLGVQAMDAATLRRRTAAAMTAGTGRSDVQLEIANAIWVDTLVRLNPSFVDAVASYHASLRSKALTAPSTVTDINAWADSATHGKINEVVDKPFPDSARLFIANAVYFKGKWLDEFDKAATRRRDFRLASGSAVDMNGMERTGEVGYGRGERFQMIRLPYRGGRFAMYVVLPDSGTPADTIEQAFVAHGMPASLIDKDFREVHFIIPRVHTELSYDLLPTLTSLGIHRAFDCDLAEFSGLAMERAAGKSLRLCIAKASQAVYLDVDEEGTEAAAVTGLLMATITSVRPPPIEFIVDRPFLFLLRDEQTGADLFVGTIRHP